MTVTNVATLVPRDRYDRPLIQPPGGGKPKAYTRCTTYVSVLEDMVKVQQWEKRCVAQGFRRSPALLDRVPAEPPTDYEGKAALNALCDEAKELGGGSDAARRGTTMHKWTEHLDRGGTLPPLPGSMTADLEAYQRATAPLQMVDIERFTVLDAFQIGGTPDRVVEHQGKRYIADLKTGSIEYGTLKIAMQLAVYARSSFYDPTTHERSDHGAEVDKGLIIHLPADEARCELVWVDLLAGWEAVKVARVVREKRRLTYAKLCTPFDGDVDLLTGTGLLERELGATVVEEQPAQELPTRDEIITGLILDCRTVAGVRDLWRQVAHEWTEEHTEVAKAHIATLS